MFKKKKTLLPAEENRSLSEKVSARTRKETFLHTRLPPGRMMAVFMAFVGLLIILVWVSLASGWGGPLKQADSRRPVSISQPQSVAQQHKKAPSASEPTGLLPGTQHPVSLQLQGINLTPNVPLSFAGSGFLPNEPLKVIIQNHAGQLQRQLAPITADAGGQVSVTEPIPAHLAPGSYRVVIEGMRSHYQAQADFQLHWIVPTVQLDTYSVKPGHDFGFAGSGFFPDEPVEIRLATPGRILTTVNANAGGNIDGRAMLPMLPEGSYALSFTGSRSQVPVEVGFTVQGFHPWVVLSNYTPSPGTRLGFTGQDFAPGEQVLVYLNEQTGPSPHADLSGQKDVVARVQADASGRFSAPALWKVPEMNGDNMLIFVGQQSGAVAITALTIMP